MGGEQLGYVVHWFLCQGNRVSEKFGGVLQNAFVEFPVCLSNCSVGHCKVIVILIPQCCHEN